MTADEIASIPRKSLEALVLEQAQQIGDHSQQLASKEERIAALEGEKAELELKLQQALRALYGRSSEKSKKPDPPVEKTLLGIPAQSEEAPATPPETETITYERQKRTGTKGHGRNPVSPLLEVRTTIIHAEPHERIGPNGEALVVVGYEDSVKLDLSPATLIRHIFRRERLGLPDTREPVITASMPPCLTPKGKATDAFIHEIIILKFYLGIPLYRQAMDMNNRDAQINESWMVDCVRNAANHYRAIAEAIKVQVLSQPFLQADETPIRQQTDTGIALAYFWVWLAGNQVYFHFGTGRSQDEVFTVLGLAEDGSLPPESILGYLQCDGYAGYNPVFTPPTSNVIRVGCWSHGRRPFFELKTNDRNAAQMVLLIDELFRIERHATKDIKKQGLDKPAADALRLQRRQAEAVPQLAIILAAVQRLTPIYSEKSRMRAALNYLTNQWETLTVYTTRGEIPLDNNAAERAIRPIAIGRKNYLFVGSEDGGEWAAIFYSIIESCRLQQIEPRRYLAHVTPLLVGGNPPPASSLTPVALHDLLSKRVKPP